MQERLDAAQLQQILDVTRQLARPFELQDILGEIVDAARDVLRAERGSIFLFDADTDELYTVVATGMEGFRLPITKGIVGECARARQTILVPDAYADSRFNREVDKQTGFRTRCLLNVPLLGHDDSLVGVLQLLNKRGGCFEEGDARVAEALGAQCAVAIQRVQMTHQLIDRERMERELSLAQDLQMSLLPHSVPQINGYEVSGASVPAEETGGDTYDFVALDGHRLLVLLGDATGHGLAPALSVTQVRSMLRIASRLKASIDDMLTHINVQLVDDLPSNRFVTAFIGMVDTVEHRVDFHAAGQAPILHYHAADGRCEWFGASTVPLGLFKPPVQPGRRSLELAPGDILGLITDGLFERENEAGDDFGQAGVERILRDAAGMPIDHLRDLMVGESLAFGGDAPQADDITVVLIRRPVAEAGTS